MDCPLPRYWQCHIVIALSIAACLAVFALSRVIA